MAPKKKSRKLLRSSKSETATSETVDIYWQNTVGSHTDRLSALNEHSRPPDLIITFPGHSTTLKVHRLVLSMSSPVFESMLSGPMAEGDELKLPEDPPEAFKWLMQYIYSGSSHFSSVHTAVQVFHLSSKYQMKTLFKLCSQYLQKNVNGSNLPLIYDAASLLEDAPLQDTCSKVLISSAETVLLSSEIGHLSRESMKYLLQQDLNIKSEVSIFKGLVKWGSTCQTLQLIDTPETKISIRQVIEEFLPQVRFLTMELHEFMENVMPSKILTPEEGIAIMMNMSYVKNFPLPKVCSKVTKKRLAYDLANMHRVILCNLPDCYLGGYHPAIVRKKFITNLKVSEDIYLGSVSIRNAQALSPYWHVEITDDSEDVLGEVKYEESDQRNCINCFEIDATFSSPVLLKLGCHYTIWVSGVSQMKWASQITTSINISNQYRNMSFVGCIHFPCYTEIGFWFPDGSL